MFSPHFPDHFSFLVFTFAICVSFTLQSCMQLLRFFKVIIHKHLFFIHKVFRLFFFSIHGRLNKLSGFFQLYKTFLENFLWKETMPNEFRSFELNSFWLKNHFSTSIIKLCLTGVFV